MLPLSDTPKEPAPNGALSPSFAPVHRGRQDCHAQETPDRAGQPATQSVGP